VQLGVVPPPVRVFDFGGGRAAPEVDPVEVAAEADRERRSDPQASPPSGRRPRRNRDRLRDTRRARRLVRQAPQCRPTPPGGWGGAGDPRGRLIRMQAKSSQRARSNPDGHPSPRHPVRVFPAEMVDAHVIVLKWKPVDATVTQSSENPIACVLTAREILVFHQNHPLGVVQSHGDHRTSSVASALILRTPVCHPASLIRLESVAAVPGGVASDRQVG
jgi:hypothetical protein